MKNKRSATKSDRSLVFGITAGSVISVIAMIAGSVLLSTLLLNETLSLNSSKFAVNIVQFLAVSIGAISAMKLTGSQKKLIAAGMTVFILLFILVGGNILIYDGDFQGIVGGIIAALLGLCVSILSQLPSKSGGVRRKKLYSR